jgi:uncharacterized membrane protein YdjX (TVP38/TMEM64 family)
MLHSRSGTRRAGDWVRLTVPFVVVALFAFAAWKLGLFSSGEQKVVAAAERIGGREWLAPIFMLVYAALSALAIPETVLAYGAGAMFGFLKGALFIWIASMAGAAGGYWLARGALAKTARRLIGSRKDKLRKLDEGNAALNTFRMRLAPVVPFGVATYTAAIAKVRPLPFFAGTAVGILPSTLLAAFIGDRFRAGVSGGNRTALWIAIGVSLALLGLSFLPTLIEKARGRGV